MRASTMLAFLSPIVLGSTGGEAQPPDVTGSDVGPMIVDCDDSEVEDWVREFRDRVLAYDALAHFAVQHHGPPTACEGAVTSEFDGARFGTLLLSFDGGVTLEVETMPPESSITTLSATSGFDEGVAIREVLQDYANGVGLAIDWGAPEVSSNGPEVVHTFWDPDPGMNASASLIYLDGDLVAVRLSMAP